MMKKSAISGLMLAAIAGWLGAQPAPDAFKQVSAGTTIPVELSKSLEAKKAKVGDKIEAKIPADVLSHGKIVIPRGARIVGHVTEVKGHSKESPGSKVGMTFDKLVLKDGGETPLQMVVQAIARPLQLAVAPDDRLGEGSGGSASSGGGMGGSMPPRSTERVAEIPTDVPPPTTVAPLAATSQGVVGMKGLALKDSVVSSETDNVRLEGGTQMILRVE